MLRVPCSEFAYFLQGNAAKALMVKSTVNSKAESPLGSHEPPMLAKLSVGGHERREQAEDIEDNFASFDLASVLETKAQIERLRTPWTRNV